MATAIYTGSASPGAAATGRPNSNRIVYAANQGAWWAFYLTGTQVFSAQYSTNGTTWNTPATSGTNSTTGGFTLANVHNSEGRNFGCGYANISGNDVLYVSSNYNISATLYAYVARYTLGTTWNATNVETEVTSGSNFSDTDAYAAPLVIFDSSNYPILISGYLHTSDWTYCALSSIATNADSGSSWTSGWGSIVDSMNSYNAGSSCGGAPIASRGYVVANDNADTSDIVYTTIDWNSWSGSAWANGSSSPMIDLLASAVTATSQNNWGMVKVSNTQVNVISLSNNSNTFVNRQFSGSAWSTATAPGTLSYAANSGVALVSDGTNIWMAVISGTASPWSIQYNKWNGSSWGGWTVQESGRTNTPTYLSACYSSAANAIQFLWTEKNGSNYEVWTSQLSLSAATFKPWIFGDQNYEMIG